MRVTMVLLLLVVKMPEPRKDLVLEELLPWLVHLVNMLNMQVMKVEVVQVQVETVQQVIRYLLAKSIQFSIIVHRGGRRL